LIQVIAHRGAAAIEPENTLLGFRRAIELGADWTECDVHLTKDARLVVVHDDTVDRTTNGTGAVRELTFEEVRALDAGKGERVPTLEEVLATVKGKIRLQVELKGAGTEAPAVRTVKEINMEREVLFTSFHLEWLRKVKEMDPSLQVGALFDKPTERACREALHAGARSIHVFYKRLTWGLVEEAHRLGLHVSAWNPDSEPEWRAMMALGVDLIGTNRPDRLIAMLRDAV
jgi:glycerophosphoryl diester phosphodiesterase